MTVAVLVTTALLVLTQLYSSIPLLPAVSETFHTDATYVLSVSFSFAYAIGFLIWGPISDHYGRVKVVCIALLVLIFTTAGCAFATSAGLLTVLRACQGLAAAGFAPVALAYMTEAVPPEHRARAIWCYINRILGSRNSGSGGCISNRAERGVAVVLRDLLSPVNGGLCPDSADHV